MVSKSLIISKLEPFLNKKELINDNQDTNDIIVAILSNHEKYKNEYDKIYTYFLADNVDDTCFNVWCFLKENFNYRIEPEEMQILRSPSAILGSDIFGIDCKGYSTFAAGVMAAYKRNTGASFDIVYRFASYDPFDNTPQHVFVVIKDNGNEYWIDPVLDEYDLKKQPYYFKDKKIKEMALVALSGINNEGIGADFSSILNQVLTSAPSIITAFNPTGTANYGGQYATPTVYQQPASTGINTSTLLMIGAVGVAAFFLLKKK